MENKKFFSKDNIFLWVCTILIGIIVLLCVLGSYADYKTNKENDNSYIILDDQNYNVSWVSDSQGNLVSQNLINVPNPSNLTYGNEPYEFSSVGISSGYYTLNFNLTNSSRATLSLYMMNSDNEEEEYSTIYKK